jgi:glutathione S-transferase
MHQLEPRKATSMKLYYHPVSTTSRTIMLFASEAGVALDYVLVDLMTGEHMKPAFLEINPNGLVPVLEDGTFRLTESSAILKYLADGIDSPAYPKGLRERARVHEVMDWINSNLYRDLGYGCAYPQLFPHHRRGSEPVQNGTIAWAQEKTRAWLATLDKNIIGADNAYLCGDKPTLADYFGAPILTLGDVLRADYGKYPNLRRWLGNMKALPSWSKVNETFNGWAHSVKEQAFLAP